MTKKTKEVRHTDIVTLDDAIEYACATVALAFHTIKNYEKPSDGFCRKCPAMASGHKTSLAHWNFQNSGECLRYVRDAVVEKLKRDGHEIDEEQFDPVTGDPKDE